MAEDKRRFKSKLARRKHGCDGCHKDVPTERFDGYSRNVLWICADCLDRMTKGILRRLE